MEKKNQPKNIQKKNYQRENQTLDEDDRGNRREQHLHFWMKIIVKSRIESSKFRGENEEDEPKEGTARDKWVEKASHGKTKTGKKRK